ncbi:MAG: hypothetical protein ACKVQT_33745 [Burkholderiales bacterium]
MAGIIANRSASVAGGLLAVAAVVLINLTALAQGVRAIPSEAVRGTVTHLSAFLVEVNGVPTQLSANVRIWSTDNLLIVPSALPPRSLVKYQLDNNRQVERMWVLTKAEADQPDRKPPGEPDRRQIPATQGVITIPVTPQVPR